MAKPQQKQLGNIRELDVDGYGSVDFNGSSIVNASWISVGHHGSLLALII